MDFDKDLVTKSLDEAYLWLGRAISDFSEVENALGRVYQSCFEFDSRPVAMHAYLGIRDTAARQSMVSRAVFYTLSFIGNPKDLVQSWRDARDAVKKLSELRNKLAHGSVICGGPEPEGDTYAAYVLPYAHTEPYADAAHRYLKGNGASPKGVWAAKNEEIYVSDLEQFTLDCDEVNSVLKAFARDLEAGLEKARSDRFSPPTQPAP